MHIDRSTILLTGATGGIGQATALHLHRLGAKLIVTGRREAELEKLVARTGARSVVCDLSASDQLHDLAMACANVDVVIHNAALPGTGTLEDQDEERINRVLDVNFRAPVILSKLIGERMLARGSGHIVFVSSLMGKSAGPSSSLYSATKFGLRGFSLGLRADWSARGVGVSAIFPGFIRDAGMFHEGGVKLPAGIGTRTPEDVSRAVEKAIVKNIAEIDVAPVSLRAGAAFSGLFPGLTAKLSGSVSRGIAEELTKGQAHKR
ncbi:MAG: SDR family NAD(P)-dependent oxidoreductase [Haloechinothrix sp.]